MQLDQKQVRHIANLARINLSTEEVDKFSSQLGAIIGFIEKLNEIDTENIPETNQVNGMKNVLREDEIHEFTKMKELIECSQNPIEKNQIRVKKSI